MLSIKTENIKKAIDNKRHYLTIIESKTKKKSSKTINKQLLIDVFEQSGCLYAFQGRDDYRKHRTRQAVYIDLKKAAKRFNIKLQLSPHSLRKNYAVYLRQKGNTVQQIQAALNHTDITTTLLYVMSNELNEKYKKNPKA